MRKKWILTAFIILTTIILIISLNIKREDVPRGIEISLDNITESVNAGDQGDFLNCIDENNREFFAEEKHLFQDMVLNPITDYKMTARQVKRLNDTEYIVRIKQSYTQGGDRSSISYDAVFKKYGEQYKFNDLYFKSIEKKYFTVKYQPSLEKEAVKLAGFIDEVHDNVRNIYGKAPEDKTIIKLYDSNEVFNALIKPSIKFNMAGWYEYPESIKINLSSKMVRLLPDNTFRDHYFTVLSHELTHRINSIESNNNIPYWLAEGLATYVENKGKPNTAAQARSIEELEKINLEELTDTAEIDSYYRDAYINTSLIIGAYGVESIYRILEELGKYPLEKSTQGVVYMESNRRFHEVIGKLYGLDIRKFDEKIH